MAKNTIKGLTVEIGGDTTQLGKALEKVNKKSQDLSAELGQVNRLLRMDPGNADLLAQKQKILADAVTNTRQQLDKLKQAEAQVQEQFKRGDVSEAQVRELQREIIATEKKLDGYKQSVKDTAEELDNLGKKTKRTAEETAEANGKMAEFTAGGLKAVGALAVAAVTSLTAMTESTREYRREMGKLDTAFTTSGFTSEQATGAYQELVGVLGETDQAVETANHLAKLTDNEKALATWTGDILPGVFATFGASLPIEGLTEAANETAKVGQVTGPLADALNWAGVSEDAFNESLSACTTEQERQALITQTLNDLYSEASANYKETNADVIAANQANDALQASMAGVGAQMEPIITEIKTIGAEILGEILPGVQFVMDNLPTLAILIGGVTAALIAFKVAQIAETAATKDMTLAQYAAASAQAVLNAVMSANPIGLIILAITALIVAIKLLWDNCDWFRELWTKLWTGIKKVVKAVVDWVKENWKAMLLFLVNPLAGVFKYCYDHFEGFRNFVKKTLTAVGNFFKQLPQTIWNGIVGAVDRVRQWGVNMVNRAKSAMTSVVTSVTSTLKALPGKVVQTGRDLVSGLWQGITDKFGWLTDKIKGFAGSVVGKIKNFFGVNSPSKETEWVGEMLDEGLARGVEDNIADPVRAMRTVSRGVLSAAEEANGLTLEQGVRRATSQNLGASAVVGGDLMGKLDSILTAIQRGQVLTIDGQALVGSTATAYDNKLGQRRALAARGAL